MAEEQMGAETGLERQFELEQLAGEYNQLKIRFTLIIILLAGVLFIGLRSAAYDFKSVNLYTVMLVTGVAELLLVTFQLLKYRRREQMKFNPRRIIFGQLLDLTNLSLGFYVLGDASPVFYPIYLWVILGNGMRFGIRLLASAAAIAAIGFSTAAIFAPYWHQNLAIAGGFLIGLVVLPFYFSILIRRINEARDKLVEGEKTKVLLLKQMDDLKTQFFANLSHEFRTPIALTLGSLEILHRDDSARDPKLVKQYEIMRRNQNRLLDLINQILDLEKMEKGKFTLKVQPILDVNAFIRARAQQFESMAQKKNLELSMELDPKLDNAPIFFDPSNMDKVVFNLLSNAFKFTNQGHVRISTKKDEDSFRIEVSDSGVGIREDQINHLFERFRQATGSESKDYAGTGIGLALVQEIVRLHGGKIDVRSVYGKGTTMSVQLRLGRHHFSAETIVEAPYSENADQDTEQADLIQEGAADSIGIEAHRKWNEELAKRADSNKKTVLFVDDNFDLREFIKDLFAETYNLYLGVNGENGYDLAKQFKPDLIISDLMMPVLDGLGYLKKIRADREFEGVPFVILTAKRTEDTKLIALEAGADDFLYKPFTRDEVTVRVRNLLLLREKSQRVKRDLLAARAIQFSLLPDRHLEIGKTHLDFLYEPCEDLSGDFFDAIQLDKSLIGYLADVTSHGTSSAQVTYIIKSIFKELFSRYADRLSVSELMSIFAEKYMEYALDFGVAMQLFKYDLLTQEFSYVNSNAPSAYLVGKDRKEVLAAPLSPLIDARFNQKEKLKFEELCIRIPQDAAIFCFSDGCYDFETKPGTFFDERHFVRELAPLYNEPNWDKLLQEKLARIRNGERAHDDVTIMRLK